MTIGKLVAAVDGRAIKPMSSGVGFVVQTTGGTTTFPRRIYPSTSPRLESVCRGEHPIAERTKAHNVPQIRANRFRIRRNRNGQSAVNIRPLMEAPAELSLLFVGERFDLRSLIRNVVRGEQSRSQFAPAATPGVELTFLVKTLRHPPVFAPAQRMWFTSKATELAALFFFQPATSEMFCPRARRAGRERVEQAQLILRSNLQNPPDLEELAKQAECSHYYPGRTFSQQVGQTIQQYLRQIRLERAAELLRTGKCNMTEAAFAVGYNSLSHFSTSFHEMFGCCPGLYPLKMPTQKPV